MNELEIFVDGFDSSMSMEGLLDAIYKAAELKASVVFENYCNGFMEVDFYYLGKEQKLDRFKQELIALATKKYLLCWKNPEGIREDMESAIKLNFKISEEGKTTISQAAYQINIDNTVEMLNLSKKKLFLIEQIEHISDNSFTGIRIKWLRNVSEFGYIMNLLEEKGYLEIPTGYNAEPSYELYTRILMNCFDVTDSFESLKDALNPKRNSLSDTKRSKLDDFPEEFPPASDLGKIRNTKKL